MISANFRSVSNRWTTLGYRWLWTKYRRLPSDRSMVIKLIDRSIIDSSSPIVASCSTIASVSPIVVGHQSWRPKIDTERVKEIIELIKTKSPIPTTLITDEELIDLPTICIATGRYSGFAKICAKWYRRIQPSIDRCPESSINAAKLLRQFGWIDQRSDGDLFRHRVNWSTIIDVMRRMIAGGFDRYTADEVIRASIGLDEFVNSSGGRARSENRIETARNFQSTLGEWLTAFEEYLTTKIAITNSRDYPTAIRWAPTIVRTLIRLGNDRSISDDALRRLFQWTKTNFDRQVGFGSTPDGSTANFHGDRFETNAFAEALVQARIDPDRYAPGLWNSWFELMATKMDDEQMENDDEENSRSSRQSLDQIAKIVLVTVEFMDQNRSISKNFWRIFPIWFARARSTLLEIYVRPRLQDPRHVPNFVYNLARLSSKFAESNDDDRRSKLRPLIGRLIEIVTRIGGGFEQTKMKRTLIGFRIFKSSLYSDDDDRNGRRFNLPETFLAMLEDWIVEIRADQRQRSMASETAASILFALKEFENVPSPSKSLLDELCSMFRWGLNDLSHRDFVRSMYFVVESCAHFGFDPGQSSENKFWSTYFARVRRHLEFDWISNLTPAERIESANSLLVSISKLIAKIGPIDEFVAMKAIYEKRLLEIFDDLNPTCLTLLRMNLDNIKASYGIQFESKLFRKRRKKI